MENDSDFQEGKSKLLENNIFLDFSAEINLNSKLSQHDQGKRTSESYQVPFN